MTPSDTPSASGDVPLDIRAEGEFDLLSLGGLVIRLDTGLVPFRKATEAQIHVSGAEYNVAANVSDAFGMRTAIASAQCRNDASRHDRRAGGASTDRG